MVGEPIKAFLAWNWKSLEIRMLLYVRYVLTLVRQMQLWSVA